MPLSPRIAPKNGLTGRARPSPRLGSYFPSLRSIPLSSLPCCRRWGRHADGDSRSHILCFVAHALLPLCEASSQPSAVSNAYAQYSYLLAFFSSYGEKGTSVCVPHIANRASLTICPPDSRIKLDMQVSLDSLCQYKTAVAHLPALLLRARTHLV